MPGLGPAAMLTGATVEPVGALRYGELAHAGWGPATAHRFGLHTPTD